MLVFFPSFLWVFFFGGGGGDGRPVGRIQNYLEYYSSLSL